jgi:hypothetical protein
MLDVAIRALIALVAAVLLYLLAVRLVRTMMAPPPPDEPDMARVEPVDLRYRCMVCGTEVTMTGSPDAEAPAAPRHCREDMTLLGVDAPR